MLQLRVLKLSKLGFDQVIIIPARGPRETSVRYGIGMTSSISYGKLVPLLTAVSAICCFVLQLRVLELSKLGFNQVVIPARSPRETPLRPEDVGGMKVVEKRSLRSAMAHLFGEERLRLVGRRKSKKDGSSSSSNARESVTRSSSAGSREAAAGGSNRRRRSTAATSE